MPKPCKCPARQIGAHQSDCAGLRGGTTYSAPAEPVPPARVPWVCSRCGAMNAPHVDVCRCSDHGVFTFENGDDLDAPRNT